jgi:hypothetical protein
MADLKFVRRLALVAAGVALLAASCSEGATAPTVEESLQVCNQDFCVDYPIGWTVLETGDRFISFAHDATEGVLATVGRVNLEGITVNAGGEWPVPPRDVVDLLWDLLDGGEAELARVDLVEGGALDSWGFIGGGRLWHRLVPITASQGFGIEVRAPNAGWEPHADVFRTGLLILNSDL